MLRSLVCSSVLLCSAPLAAQVATGRTLDLLAPVVMGQTMIVRLTYPAAAAGNSYAIHICSPQFSGVASIAMPGVTFHGSLLVDPVNSMQAFAGTLGSSGSESHSFAVPNLPYVVGYAFDLQSADLDLSTLTTWFSENELALTVSDSIPIGMMPIPAGTFSMGSNVAGGLPFYGLPNQRPVHQVTISRPFWIGKYEVTQAEYLAVMGNNPSHFQPPIIASYNPDLPVESVSWNAAMAYCAALTAQEVAANRVPTGYEYRLPTEAEWEYCCRAGTTTEFHYGQALYCGDARFGFSYHTNSSCGSSGTVVVGGYVSNAWGLHDMHGNVWEWCLDWWGGGPNYPIAPVVDPYVTSGADRVNRGGSWYDESAFCRSAFREHRSPGFSDQGVGFRVVLAPIL